MKQLTASDTAGLGCELFKSILKSALKCSFIKCHKEQAPSLSQPQVSTGPALFRQSNTISVEKEPRLDISQSPTSVFFFFSPPM